MKLVLPLFIVTALAVTSCGAKTKVLTTPTKPAYPTTMMADSPDFQLGPNVAASPTTQGQAMPVAFWDPDQE